MTCKTSIGCYSEPTGCPDVYGCIKGVCPDFVIKRNDTKPPFKVKVEDCDGPMNLKGLVLEANMWAKGKLKSAIKETDDYFALADNIGFHQLMVGDIIIVDRPRLPEKMLVTAFDEVNYLVKVQRGYHGTTKQKWKKGTPIRIMKFQSSTAQTEMVFQDIIQLDGTVKEDVLVESYLVYEWENTDTCLPGCYYLEFKLIKMKSSGTPAMWAGTSGGLTAAPVIVPSFTDPKLTPADFGCGLPVDVDWIRRFPVDGEGFLIKIFDSPTSELG